MRNSAFISALIYTGISLLAAGLFFAGTYTGEFKLTEKIGGAIWVFILSMIILMPVIIPLIKRKFDKNG